MLLKVNIDKNSSSYNDFTLFKTDIIEPFDLNNDEYLKDNFSPSKNKYFNQDIFNYDVRDKTIYLYSSSTREAPYLPGILKLEKTYGKYKNKLLYKCIPDDKRLPHFLIPYNIPCNFNKNNISLFILFKFLNWDFNHPYGIIIQNLGVIDNLSNFYEYILYCKSLQISNSKFNKMTNQKLKTKTHDEWIQQILTKNNNIIDRTKGYYVFSIDGSSTTDFDDAISFQNNILSIYISNVAIWLDILNLWDAFSRRVSTIYLPNQKRNMLPNILSDELCSLIKNQNKIALTMDIHLDIDETNNIKSILKIEFHNCLIKLKENFIYESPKLLKNKHYNHILDIVKELNKNHLPIHNIRGSNDVISYLMIFMNYKSSICLKQYNSGIFRKLEQIYNDDLFKHYPNILDEDKQFLTFYNSNCAQYCKAYQSNYNTFMYKNINQYTHITSPIRRLVDLLNSIIIQKKCNLWNFNDNYGAIQFYNKWENDLDYINLMMRSIRKVQNNCKLFNLLNENKSEKIIYKGLCFDGFQNNNKMKKFNVYIKELNYIGKYCVSNEIVEKYNISDFNYYNFEIYLFLNEENMKKKIKIKLVINE